MIDSIVPLVVGFLLITVLGGGLGTYLQQRSWKHQNDARLREEELRRADDVCRAVSQLMDRRLYRMLRLFHALDGDAGDPDRPALLTRQFGEYDQVLYEWNDQLNLNLARLGTYFGESARDWLDLVIYENFRSVGSDLERAYRQAIREPSAVPLDGLYERLGKLNDQVYELGVFMMTRLREGQVGGRAPQPLRPAELRRGA
jgi:hypothetical protein